MLKLKLIVREVLPNNAVVLIPSNLIVYDPIVIETGEPYVGDNVDTAIASGTVRYDRREIHPAARMQIVPFEADRHEFAIGNVFDVTLRKVE